MAFVVKRQSEEEKQVKDVVHEPQTTSDQKYLRFVRLLLYILLVVL